MAGWWARWLELDARLAREARARFEARTGRGGAARTVTWSADELRRSFARLHGPTVVHHWATSIADDADSLPVLHALADELDVVTVCWDLVVGGERDAAAVDRWLAAHRLRLPTTLVAADGAAEALGVDPRALPVTLCLHRDGAVLRRWRGPLTDGVVAELRRVVRG